MATIIHPTEVLFVSFLLVKKQVFVSTSQVNKYSTITHIITYRNYIYKS